LEDSRPVVDELTAASEELTSVCATAGFDCCDVSSVIQEVTKLYAIVKQSISTKQAEQDEMFKRVCNDVNILFTLNIIK